MPTPATVDTPTCPDCGNAYLLLKETKKEGRVLFCANEACHYKREAA